VSFLTEDDVKSILNDVREELLPNLSFEVANWKDNYSPRDTPASHFEPFHSALSDYAKAFEGDAEALYLIAGGQSAIAEATADLDTAEVEEPDHDEYYHRRSSGPPISDSRSIFDDVDD
jgi:hypothetical protein